MRSWLARWQKRGLIDKVKKIKEGAIQQYRAMLSKFRRMIKNYSSSIKVASQKGVPVQQRKLGRVAEQVNKDQHVGNLEGITA